jgi:hypothetical protein
VSPSQTVAGWITTRVERLRALMTGSTGPLIMGIAQVACLGGVAYALRGTDYRIHGVAAFLVGGMVGFSELISRYRDAPLQAATSIPGGFYCLANGLSALAALVLIREMEWLDTLADTPTKTLLMQTILAATGAMAFFRSSLFMVRINSTDLGVGPAAFLQILMTATDRAVDRTRAQPRAEAVRDIMANIDFTKAREALPSLCFNLMQNVSPLEIEAFNTQIARLQASAMDDSLKANNLGLALMNVVGRQVLAQAVSMLRDDIAELPRPVAQDLKTLQLLRNLTLSEAGAALVEQCLFLTDRIATQDDDDAQKELARIRQLGVSDRQKMLLLSASLIGRFTEAVVQSALASLPANDPPTPITPSTELVTLLDGLPEHVAPAQILGVVTVVAGRMGDDALRTLLTTQIEQVVGPTFDPVAQRRLIATILLRHFPDDLLRRGLGVLMPKA